MKYIICGLILVFSCTGCSSQNKLEIAEVSFSYTTLKGLEPENGICRRDPSDVIEVDGVDGVDGVDEG